MASLAVARVSNDADKPIGRAEQLVTDPLIEILQLHRALRLELQGLVEELFGAGHDAGRLGALVGRFARFELIFRSHSGAEDEVLFPALKLREARDGVSVKRPEDDPSGEDAQHAKELRLLRAAKAALAAFHAAAEAEEDEAAAKAAGDAAKDTLVELKELLCDHMLEEEEDQLPRLRRAFSRAELLQLTGAIMGSRGVEETVATYRRLRPLSLALFFVAPTRVSRLRLEIVVPNLEPPQARHMLATMTAVAPRFRQFLARLSAARQSGGAVTDESLRDDEERSRSASISTVATDESAGAAAAAAHVGGASAKKRRRTEKPRSPAAAAKPPGEAPTYHCPYCDARHPGRGLGIDAFHCMRCATCVPCPKGRPCSRSPRFVHVCGDGVSPYEAAAVDDTGNQVSGASADVACACAICAKDVFANLELLDTLPCGHVAHSRCLAAVSGPEGKTRKRPVCAICPPPGDGAKSARKAPRPGTGPKAGAAPPSPLDVLLCAINKVSD